ncbi:hypothetical protein HPB48_004018 [Haemaphysalis longicornis]|uniref:Uncharacterized protein n=1 Tax=Haemaphysalis longicornis TaxID=44386 RepID=A0A9J6GJW1_HAELO|nr:hypothetical protein HPB48_004018 [Haemaphysalis longicornis]
MDNRLANSEESLTQIMNQCARVEILESTVEDATRTVQHQPQRLIDLEDRARRNNIIVCGVPESENETREDIEQEVVKISFPTHLASWSRQLKEYIGLVKRNSRVISLLY